MRHGFDGVFTADSSLIPGEKPGHINALHSEHPEFLDD
jgi:hypothetical protein